MNVLLTLADPTSHTDGSAATPADTVSINVYRQFGDGALAKVGTADPTATPPAFTDQNLTPGTYGYAVSAVDKAGVESAHSDLFPVVIAAAAAPLSPPTIVSAVES